MKMQVEHIPVAAWLSALGTWLHMRGFVPDGGHIIAMVILVALDTATGIKAARVKGEAIDSKSMRRITGKIMAYMIVITAFTIVSAIMPLGAVRDWFVSVPIVLACLVELYSIHENCHVIWPKSRYFSVMKTLLNRKIDNTENGKDSA